MEVDRTSRLSSDVAVTSVKKETRILKGPPLASRSHTVQIFIMLTLNNILLIMCLFVLPAHLLWRKALKQHQLSDFGSQMYDNSTTKADSFGLHAIVEAKSESHSAIRNIITAFGILFKIPLNDTLGVKWIRHAFRSSLAALFLSQGWFVARLKGWWDEAEAMEQGDRDEVLRRRRIGISKRMEDVTLSSFASPLPIAGWYLLLILCGAPATKNHLDTLFVSAYLSILLFLPAFALLGTDEYQWQKAFTVHNAASTTARFRLVRLQALCTLIGTLLGSAGHLLDWEKAWQMYPIPNILGACIGIVVGNCLGFLTYYYSLPSASPRMESPSFQTTALKVIKRRRKSKSNTLEEFNASTSTTLYNIQYQAASHSSIAS